MAEIRVSTFPFPLTRNSISAVVHVEVDGVTDRTFAWTLDLAGRQLTFGSGPRRF